MPSADFLKRSRALWLARERYRHNRWRFYRYVSKRPAEERLRLRDKWWKLYVEARTHRLRRDDQIEKLRAEHVSKRGIDLIKEFEGFSAAPYRDPVGVWTIGYGETKGIGPNTPHWSEAKAASHLLKRVDRDYAPHVKKLGLPLTQNQFDALTSFVYNLGPGAIGPGTGIGSALRRRQWQVAADELLKWDKAGGKRLEGLSRRRRAERALFLR